MPKRAKRRVAAMRNSSLYINRALDRRARAYARLCGVSFSDATAQLWRHQLALVEQGKQAGAPHPCLVDLTPRH